MSNKQALVYGVLESANDLRSVFVRHSHFKKPTKFRKFIELFHCCMTRLRNTNMGVFMQCQYTRTILRNKNMGQSQFKKHSKFQNFHKYFNGHDQTQEHKVECFYTMSIHKNYFKKQKYGTESV